MSHWSSKIWFLNGYNGVYPNHAVFNGYVEAYKQHRPITISPDIIWLLIIQEFANQINNNTESLRSMFVNFDGKQELTVKQDNMMP